MDITDATDTQIEAILDGTHALWSDGLERPAYGAYVRALRETAWGRAGGYRFLALRDEGGRVVSAMKLYRFEARAGDHRITIGGVGALFTPPADRGRGHAARLLDFAHAEMAARGDAASLLHSEIGEGYYERLGYLRIEPDAAWIRVPAASPEPFSVMLRRVGPGEPATALHLVREAEDRRAAFALLRDAHYWDYLRRRAEIPSRHMGEQRWESRLVVHEREGKVLGYLWSLLREPPAAAAHDGGAAARVLELGESTAGSSLPLLLDDLFGACRRRGIAAVEVWQGGEMARRDPRCRQPGALSRPESLPVIPMWRPLRDDLRADLAATLRGAPLLLSDVF